MNLAPRDVEALTDELVAYQQVFAPLFARTEQRQWARAYLHGQLLDLERKSIAPMARALPDGAVQAMQQFISVGAWDDTAILAQHQRLVADTRGAAATGVLIIDGCDFPKQGTHSVGVARQWCGALGKVASCQASVVAGYASACGYTLVDRRLYLPEVWFTDGYTGRRAACGVPPDLPFQTRHQLAWALIATLHARGVLPFQWVTCAEQYGMSPALLDQVADVGLTYFAEVPRHTQVWCPRPPTAVPPARGRGRPPHRARVVPGAPAAGRVEQLGAQLPADLWVRRVIKEGAKGPLAADCARVRAVAVREGLPGPEVWVVFRRSVSDTAERKTYLSNAPTETPLDTLVWASGMRGPVEAAILECKSAVGMDHYEVRGWVGWQQHLTMSLLAQHFLVRLRCRLGGKSPALTVPQVRVLLQATLPRRASDAVAVLALVRYTQQQNDKAYCAHHRHRYYRDPS